MLSFKQILEVGASFSLVIAGIFFTLERYQSTESKGIRRSIEEFWDRVNIEHWLSLPEQAVRGFLKISKIPWKAIEYLVIFGPARFKSAGESIAYTAPVVMVHLARLPAVFKVFALSVAVLGLLGHLTTVILFPARFLPHRQPNEKKKKILRFIEPLSNIGVTAIILLIAVENVKIDYMTNSTVVLWLWMLFVVLGCLFLFKIAVLKWFGLQKVKAFLQHNLVVFLSLVPLLLVAWSLYITGTLDITRLYASSASFIGSNYATKGGILNPIIGLFLLIAGAHIIALSLYSFCRPTAALIYFATRSGSVDHYEEKLRAGWSLFFMSILFTTIAMALGSYVTPTSQHSLTVRMLISNYLCDAFTITFTIWIFRKLGCNENWLMIPIALFLSFFVGGICAFNSLFLGLLGTSNEMSASQVLMVMAGIDPQNSNRSNFDGYFFVMHTTFIPLAVYVAICMSLWWSKLILKLGNFLFVPRDRIKRPYGLARASFMLLAATLAFVRIIIA